MPTKKPRGYFGGFCRRAKQEDGGSGGAAFVGRHALERTQERAGVFQCYPQTLPAFRANLRALAWVYASGGSGAVSSIYTQKKVGISQYKNRGRLLGDASA